MDCGNHRSQRCRDKRQRQQRADRLGPGYRFPSRPASHTLRARAAESAPAGLGSLQGPGTGPDRTGRPEPSHPPPRRDKGLGFRTCHRLTISGLWDTQSSHCSSQWENVTRSGRQNLSGLLGERGIPGQDPTWRRGGTVGQEVVRAEDYARLRPAPTLCLCV